MTPQFPQDKKEIIEALLAEPVLARLGSANASNNQPHVVPVWFLWDGAVLWISAFSSTRKVKDLQSNPKAAVLIEPLKTDQLQAVLFEGSVEVIQEPRPLVRDLSMRIYIRYMGEEGAHAEEPTSWSVDPENRLIKLTPDRIFAW
jgi:nitroimidazol reductase NimA-like FMN-containing flavoprotein (pyridoxamine 5'-phosphate oxidase superfamily)